MALRTVRPPTPESKRPIGNVCIVFFLGGIIPPKPPYCARVPLVWAKSRFKYFFWYFVKYCAIHSVLAQTSRHSRGINGFERNMAGGVWGRGKPFAPGWRKPRSAREVGLCPPKRERVPHRTCGRASSKRSNKKGFPLPQHTYTPPFIASARLRSRTWRPYYLRLVRLQWLRPVGKGHGVKPILPDKGEYRRCW